MPTEQKRWLAVIGAVIGMVFVIGVLGVIIVVVTHEQPPDDPQACLQDISCVSGYVKWWRNAEFDCRRRIEGTALHGFEWTDGSGPKFRKVQLDPHRPAVRYLGDGAGSPDLSGGWIELEYACVYDPINRRVFGANLWPDR